MGSCFTDCIEFADCIFFRPFQLLRSQAEESSQPIKTTYLVELLGLLKHILKSRNQSATSKPWAKLGQAVTLLAGSKPLSAAVVSAVRSLASMLHLT